MINPINKAPFKPQKFKLSKGLIFNIPKDDSYYLINHRNGNVIGKMCASIEKDVDNLYKKGIRKRVFYIKYLKVCSEYQQRGWGKYLIDFAKAKSAETVAEGRVCLYSYNPSNIPHLFYKKQGFITKNKNFNREMDKCINKHTPFTEWRGLRMYLPLNNISKDDNVKKTSFISKLIEYFKH